MPMCASPIWIQGMTSVGGHAAGADRLAPAVDLRQLDRAVVEEVQARLLEHERRAVGEVEVRRLVGAALPPVDEEGHLPTSPAQPTSASRERKTLRFFHTRSPSVMLESATMMRRRWSARMVVMGSCWWG
jgi:hypothetical protein